MKAILTGLLPEEITSVLELKEKFRGKQIFSWIGKGVRSLDEMTNLSKSLREEIAAKADLYSSTVTQVLHDSD
ncbi:MAG: 23S rRNA (adenine(2503)-C2)-methyltransferase, partial [Spirochaetaceae bacterium]|nr:23S rRNA (adenine(2503)-C2)-methyltransferase [Spirochaetaceae bacterium]